MMGPEESQTAAQFPERVSRGNPRAKIATGMALPCLVIYQEQPVGSMVSAGTWGWIQKDSS